MSLFICFSFCETYYTLSHFIQLFPPVLCPFLGEGLTIASILKNGLDKPDKAESQPAQPKTNSYGITRGAAYFRKGGDR